MTPRSLTTLAVFFALAAASGCEVRTCETKEGKSGLCLESLERFEGEDKVPDPWPYMRGMSLTVDGVYGDLRVRDGNPGEVAVVFSPFTYRGHDEEKAARSELANEFDGSVDEEDGTITVRSARHDSTNGLGADITVYLPPEFDGALVVLNHSNGPVNPGNVEVDSVGSATSVDVSTDSLGDCSVSGAESIVSTRARCDGSIHVTGVVDDLDLASTGLTGDIDVTLAAIGSGASGGSVTSEDGDILLRLPGAAVFSVQAQSTADSAVSEGTLPDGCAVQEAAPTSKTVSCGTGGPNYVVTAGTDGVGPSSVELQYR